MILIFVSTTTLVNLRISLRRARDVQRKEDLFVTMKALDEYQQDFGFFPPSSDDGKIIACKGENYDEGIIEIKKAKEIDLEKYFALFAPCEWGKSKLQDVSDMDYPAYMDIIPRDPKHDNGVNYIYISNTRTYQLYAYLEGGKSEDEHEETIVERNLSCGIKTCNFGRGHERTPLDKSLEEYENELAEQKSNKI